SAASCTSPVSMSTGTLTTVGTWSFELQATDTGSPSEVTISTPASITVNGSLSAGPITPNIPSIDAGESVTLSANASDGTTPYSYQWYSAFGCTTGSLISGATSSTYLATPTSATTYSYKVTDSSQGTPAASQCSPGDI